SVVMEVAADVRVPAGAALAVDREQFAEGVTARLMAHDLVSIERGEVRRVPPATPASPVIVATGPLTSAELSDDIATLVGQGHLAFFDAISPIVHADSIDMSRVFRASRWNRSLGRIPADSADGVADNAGSE